MTRVKKATRINIGAIDDDYVLGILCEKAGLVAYAKRSLVGIDGEGERARLFDQGVEDADQCTLRDIARELWMIRWRNPRLFDGMVGAGIGKEALAEIVEVAEMGDNGKRNIDIYAPIIAALTGQQELAI